MGSVGLGFGRFLRRRDMRVEFMGESFLYEMRYGLRLKDSKNLVRRLCEYRVEIGVF